MLYGVIKLVFHAKVITVFWISSLGKSAQNAKLVVEWSKNN
jgi:hypothetical protein